MKLTDHSEHIRMVVTAFVVFLFFNILTVNHPGESQTEVGSEYVDEHGTSNVGHLELGRLADVKEWLKEKVVNCGMHIHRFYLAVLKY